MQQQANSPMQSSMGQAIPYQMNQMGSQQMINPSLNEGMPQQMGMQMNQQVAPHNMPISQINIKNSGDQLNPQNQMGQSNQMGQHNPMGQLNQISQQSQMIQHNQTNPQNPEQIGQQMVGQINSGNMGQNMNMNQQILNQHHGQMSIKQQSQMPSLQQGQMPNQQQAQMTNQTHQMGGQMQNNMMNQSNQQSPMHMGNQPNQVLGNVSSNQQMSQPSGTHGKQMHPSQMNHQKMGVSIIQQPMNPQISGSMGTGGMSGTMGATIQRPGIVGQMPTQAGHMSGGQMTESQKQSPFIQPQLSQLRAQVGL